MLKIDPTNPANIISRPITGILSNFIASDFAFRSDGVLFMVLPGNSGLYTVNTSTGAATLVGTVASVTTARGLAFSANDTLYLADSTNLYTVDQSTGSLTIVHGLAFDAAFGSSPMIQSMEFDRVTGKLYAGGLLALVNTTTGAVTPAGPVQPLITLAIPFTGVGTARAVPALSVSGLIVLSALLAGAAVLFASDLRQRVQ